LAQGIPFGVERVLPRREKTSEEKKSQPSRQFSCGPGGATTQPFAKNMVKATATPRTNKEPSTPLLGKEKKNKLRDQFQPAALCETVHYEKVKRSDLGGLGQPKRQNPPVPKGIGAPGLPVLSNFKGTSTKKRVPEPGTG